MRMIRSKNNSNMLTWDVLRCSMRGIVISTLATMLVSRTALATTIADVSLEKLTELSERCGVYLVTGRTHADPPSSNRSRISYDLQAIDELCAPQRSSSVSIAVDTRIIGSPIFKNGDMLFLFLRPSNRIEKVLGFSVHSYRVTDAGEIRNYSGKPIRLVETQGLGVRSGETVHKVRELDGGRAPDSDSTVTVQTFRQIVTDTNSKR